jgi:2-dehydropantoate 2-reductase
MGAGGVGGYFGARLAQHGEPVSVVARGPHLEAIKAHGLRLRSVHGDASVRVPASDDPRELGEHDLVLFCVKGYDTEAASRQIEPVVGPATIVLSLQNGIDNETIIEPILGSGRVMGGSTRIVSTIAEPGVIEQSSESHRLDFGEMQGGRSERAERLLATFTAAGIDAHLSENIELTLWEKFLGLCPIACVSAAARTTLGETMVHEPTRRVMRGALEEIVAVAKAEGIDLGGDTAVERSMAFSSGRVEPNATASLYRDVVAGKRLEIDTLAGAVMRLGRQHDIPTPVHELLYGILYPAHYRAVQEFEAAGG